MTCIWKSRIFMIFYIFDISTFFKIFNDFQHFSRFLMIFNIFKFSRCSTFFEIFHYFFMMFCLFRDFQHFSRFFFENFEIFEFVFWFILFRSEKYFWSELQWQIILSTPSCLKLKSSNVWDFEISGLFYVLRTIFQNLHYTLVNPLLLHQNMTYNHTYIHTHP